MSVREDIRQRVRAFLKVACLPSGGTLTDEQVIKAEDVVKGGGPRPVVPFLTVKVLMSDRMVGTDESRIQSVADPDDFEWYATGRREATASVQGYGEDTSDWLTRARLRLLDPDLLAEVLGDAGASTGFTMQASGAQTDITALLGDSWETRYLQEFLISYEVDSSDDKQTFPAASTLVTEMTFESDSDPGDFSRTITTAP